jgi:hypothetical protein
MNRRDFLAMSLLGSLGYAAHSQQCGMIAPGVQGCRAQISLASIALAATLQQCPEWCWAASISAVFKFFGHPLDQQTIVMQKYHQLVCMPALTAQQIASDLSATWTDKNGTAFTSTLTAAYDAQAGVLAINNAIIVNELLNQRPLLYCNKQHAMVIVAADYRPGPYGPIIDGIGVMDPWPPSPRLHPLSPQEMIPAHLGGQMSFLGAVSVV